MNDPEFEQILEQILLPRARALKAQAALMTQTASEMEAAAEKAFALAGKVRAPGADFDALLREAEALRLEMKRLTALWNRFLREFNALSPQS